MMGMSPVSRVKAEETTKKIGRGGVMIHEFDLECGIEGILQVLCRYVEAYR